MVGKKEEKKSGRGRKVRGVDLNCALFLSFLVKDESVQEYESENRRLQYENCLIEEKIR